MMKIFEEALMDLIAKYETSGEPLSDMISALELRLMALKEAEAEEKDDNE